MNIPKSASRHLNKVWWILKLTYGLFFIIIGVHWRRYLNPTLVDSKGLYFFFDHNLGLMLQHYIYVVIFIEIVIGLMILTRWSKPGGYLAAGWLIFVAAHLFYLAHMMNRFGGLFTAEGDLVNISLGLLVDFAIRNIVLAIGALTLACLTTIKNEIEESS